MPKYTDHTLVLDIHTLKVMIAAIRNTGSASEVAVIVRKSSEDEPVTFVDFKVME